MRWSLNCLLFYIPISDSFLSSLPEVKIFSGYIHTCQVIHLFYLCSSISSAQTLLSPHLIFQFGGNRDEVKQRHSETKYIHCFGIWRKEKTLIARRNPYLFYFKSSWKALVNYDLLYQHTIEWWWCWWWCHWLYQSNEQKFPKYIYTLILQSTERNHRTGTTGSNRSFCVELHVTLWGAKQIFSKT